MGPKSRLIIDLLRSGVNGDVANPERLVLPSANDCGTIAPLICCRVASAGCRFGQSPLADRASTPVPRGRPGHGDQEHRAHQEQVVWHIPSLLDTARLQVSMAATTSAKKRPIRCSFHRFRRLPPERSQHSENTVFHSFPCCTWLRANASLGGTGAMLFERGQPMARRVSATCPSRNPSSVSSAMGKFAIHLTISTCRLLARVN